MNTRAKARTACAAALAFCAGTAFALSSTRAGSTVVAPGHVTGRVGSPAILVSGRPMTAAPVYRPSMTSPAYGRVRESGFPYGLYAPRAQFRSPSVRPISRAPIARRYDPGVPYPSGPYHHWHGPIVGNPHHWHVWGWNNGVVWYPVPLYWGGGFWGPWIVGTGTGFLLSGAVINYDVREIYPSYDVEPSSPGAQLLANYSLVQTQCGPPNLVDIWGPGNSVICAFPNGLVSAGNYEFDPATLTIRSLGSQ